MNPFRKKPVKEKDGEVVTMIVMEAILTTYSVDHQFLGARSVRFQLPEPDIPAAMLEFVRQRVPKKEG